MLQLEIQVGEKRLPRTLPQSWQECSPQQALFCLRVLNNSVYTRNRAELELLQKFLSVPYHVWFRLNPADLAAMQDQLQWVYLGAGPVPLLSHFKHRFRSYIMPKPKAENLTAMEYAIADAFYDDIVAQQGDPQQAQRSMVLLAATLAREVNPDTQKAIEQGDQRVPLRSREEAESRALKFNNLAPEYLHAVLLYWQGVKEYIYNLYGRWLFNRPEEDDETEDQEEDEDQPRAQSDQQGTGMFGWWGLYMDIAEKNVFGNLDAVHHTNFHTVCMYLVKQVEAQRAMEKEMARQRALIQSHKTGY